MTRAERIKYSAAGFVLLALFAFASNMDYQDELCDERHRWEATGHEYVGIPAGAEHCEPWKPTYRCGSYCVN